MVQVRVMRAGNVAALVLLRAQLWLCQCKAAIHHHPVRLLQVRCQLRAAD